MSGYEAPGDTEGPATDVMIARLITHRMARGDQDGFGVRVWARPSEGDWLLSLTVRQPGFGGTSEWSRAYDTRTDLYRMFDWYVDELSLEEQPLLTEEMPDDVVQERLDVLAGTDTDLHGGQP